MVWNTVCVCLCNAIKIVSINNISNNSMQCNVTNIPNLFSSKPNKNREHTILKSDCGEWTNFVDCSWFISYGFEGSQVVDNDMIGYQLFICGGNPKTRVRHTLTIGRTHSLWTQFQIYHIHIEMRNMRRKKTSQIRL